MKQSIKKYPYMGNAAFAKVFLALAKNAAEDGDNEEALLYAKLYTMAMSCSEVSSVKQLLERGC